MFSDLADYLLQLLPTFGIRTLSRTKFIPVLHVERLHDDSSFERTLAFAKKYLDATGEKALLTVITPVAPMLAKELQEVGFSEGSYRERLLSIARYSEIGLHGHYLRNAAATKCPVHNYWNESALVSAQIELECGWLEQNGLMKHRVYSGGWWHLDKGLVRSLGEQRFVMDFSASTARFNDSPAAADSEKYRRLPIVFPHTGSKGVAAIWAVSSLGDSVDRSFVVRRALTAFPSILYRKDESFLSLYSHDWDLNLEGAMRTISELKAHGAGFVSLDALIGRRAEADCATGAASE